MVTRAHHSLVGAGFAERRAVLEHVTAVAFARVFDTTQAVALRLAPSETLGRGHVGTGDGPASESTTTLALSDRADGLPSRRNGDRSGRSVGSGRNRSGGASDDGGKVRVERADTGRGDEKAENRTTTAHLLGVTGARHVGGVRSGTREGGAVFELVTTVALLRVFHATKDVALGRAPSETLFVRHVGSRDRSAGKGTAVETFGNIASRLPRSGN